MKLLLGATVALLLGALAVSWQGMNSGVKNASPDEIARLKKQIAELRAEHDKLQLEKQFQQIRAATPPTPNPVSTAAELEAMKAQIEAGRAAIAELEAEKERRDAIVERDEEGLLEQRNLEKGDSELRRARLIAEALLIGTIQEVVEDAEYGGFITFQILMPEQVQPGTILAIRRQTGILGQLSVSDVTPEGGIANQMHGFGPIQPVVGDELILPPPF